ncbi:MAG: ferrochelatase [Coriobacteriia bacterium]|nr:ferrochelatase [Coriobacteriia bacterium]
MPVTYWVTLSTGGMLVGAALVGILSLRRSAEPAMALLMLMGTASSVYGVWGVASDYGRPEVTAAGVLLSAGCVIGGYGLASASLPSLFTRIPTVDLGFLDMTRRVDGVCVLVIACVEPERYEPSMVADELHELEVLGLPETTIGVTPFLFAAQKTRYRAAGGRSPSPRQAEAVVERLESVLDAERFPLVRLITCAGRDLVATTFARAVDQGFREFVIANLSAAESSTWERAKEDLAALRPDDYEIRIAYTTPLWASERLSTMLTERILPLVQEHESSGVALVVHGQSDFRSRRQPQFDVQENAFANRIRMGLAEHGVSEADVRLCFAEWGTPDIVETVRHLAALGSTRILVCPTCYPFESIATVLDFAVAIRQARVSPAVYVTTLTAWGNDPIVAETLRERVEAAAREFD